MTDPAIDATAVEEQIPEAAETGRELAARQTTGTLTVAPDADAEQLVARLDVIKAAMETAMKPGIDYGVIPGVDKPVLAKPGAEKLSVLFQLDVQIDSTETWGPGDHLTVKSEATVYHAPTGTRLGAGKGMCTTREKKYAKRHADRACPQCEQATIKRSKFPPRNQPNAEPGWYCYAKLGGCGQEYAHDDPRITGQQTGDIDNPDLPDTWNTVLKMAEKRARVDAILAVTGASALFTQDVEAPAGNATSAPAAASSAPKVWPATDKQLAALKRERTKHGDDSIRAHMDALGITLGQPLTKADASRLLDAIKTGPAPIGGSDVPGDPSDFDTAPAGDDADVPF